MVHWVDVIADDLLKEGMNHVVASGTSISGMIHIGNAGDVIMADAVCRAIREKGGTARLLWIMDDMDPLRKVPPQLPKEFEKYIGAPVSKLPWNSDETFVQHSIKPFIASLKKIGIAPEIISSTDLYESGKYDEYSKKAIECAGRIREILKEISGADKAETWLPFDVVCERCGKIATTDAISYENGNVHYVCKGGVAGKQKIEGCGYEGDADLRHGKLTWRVEWAARWKMLHVTCEPFGKEHAASGGSYDTSKVISNEIFGYKPPYPVIYEHILVNGQKMSKSLGNIIALEEMLDVVMPEVVRYFFFRTKATRHKDFEIAKDVLSLIEEYERIERLYYGVEAPSPAEDLAELKRNYELSQTSSVKKSTPLFFQVAYRHLLNLVQIYGNYDDIIDKLLKMDQLDARPTTAHAAALKEKIQLVKNFIERYAPDQMKFVVQPAIISEARSRLTDSDKKCLRLIADYLEKSDGVSEEKLQNFIYSAAKENGLNPAALFKTLYRIFVNKDHGPKLAGFFLSLDRNFVIERLRDGAS